MQGALVQSLARELRSCRPHGTAKKKIKLETSKKNTKRLSDTFDHVENCFERVFENEGRTSYSDIEN